MDQVLSRHAAPGDEALSCLAVGADQVFAEAALAAGLRLHAVVPCLGIEATFSAAELPGYQALLAAASRVTTLDFTAPSEDAFDAAGRFVVSACDLLVAVWDGEPARGKGGTGDIVKHAREVGRPVIHIDPQSPFARDD
jgi:hypothetical protein